MSSMVRLQTPADMNHPDDEGLEQARWAEMEGERTPPFPDPVPEYPRSPAELRTAMYFSGGALSIASPLPRHNSEIRATSV